MGQPAVATASIAVIGLDTVLAGVTTGVFPSMLIAMVAYGQYQVLHSARESVSMDLTTRTAANLAWYSRLHSQPTPDVVTPAGPGAVGRTETATIP